jgi:hypothetical protein
MRPVPFAGEAKGLTGVGAVVSPYAAALFRMHFGGGTGDAR